MEIENYYFNKHIILFKYVLNEIINYETKRYCIEDRDFDNNGKYIWNNEYEIYEYGNDKLYGDYEDYEDYWDSIYN